MSNRLILGSLALFFAIMITVPVFPAAAQEDAPLEVVSEHVINIFRAEADADVRVIENIFLENTGDEAFDGDLWLDLDPEAEEIAHYFHNTTGEPYPGGAGRPERTALENSTQGAHQRHILNFGDRGLVLQPGQSVILVLDYQIDAQEDSFTRGFTLDTEIVDARVSHVPGLRPESDETPMEAVRDPNTGNWGYRLAPDETGPFAPGERFTFTWVENEVPLDPLTVDIQVEGENPLTLRANAQGGIGPDYEYTWDLDGDGECDDAEGQSVEVPFEEEDVHEIMACVTDQGVPPGEASQRFQARTVFVEGRWDGPNPWLLLVIGLLGGGFLVFALTQGGFVPAGTRRAAPSGTSFGAESREMLETRQRVMVAALKELEIAKKKGEVPESMYTSLKSELKKDTVNVMRELERRKTEKETV